MQTLFTTVPSTTTQRLTTTTATIYSIVAYTVTAGKKKRELEARQAITSALSTPSALATFSPDILSSACSEEVAPVTQASVETQYKISTSSSTTTTTAQSTTAIATVIQTSSTTQIITSGVSTNAVSTITTTTTIYSTTTITVASNAPTAVPNYLAISPVINPNAGWALSDPSTHMTDNYFFPSRREVFALTSTNQLYSVTNNSYYGIATGTTTGKIIWDTRSQYGNKTWYGKPLTDGTGRTQLYLNNTAVNAPFSFCVANLTSADNNAATGYHLYFYVTASQVTVNCKVCGLFLSPVGNG
ncbi:hypothetical protein MMC21_001448 [Puttea exsequens]|nr:hypothetical protein [Puttea exsequens]